MASSSFLIVLENPERLYFSGEDVRGHVCYRPDGASTLTRVEISFQGRLKSKIALRVQLNQFHSQHRSYRDRVALFEESSSLWADEKRMERGNDIELPFTFSFPPRVIPRRVGSWTSTTPGTPLPEQELPPSSETRRMLLDTGFYSSVSYKLVASAHFAKGRRKTCEQSLALIPVVYDAPVADDGQRTRAEECIARGSNLVSENPATPLPAGEKLRALLPWSRLPTLSLRVSTSVPLAFTPSDPLRLRIQLEVQPPRRGEPVPNPPPFYLKMVQAAIACETTVTLHGLMKHTGSKTQTISEGSLQDDRHLIIGDNDIAVQLSPIYLPPSVELSSWKQAYHVEVKFIIETDGGTHRFVLRRREPLRVRPLQRAPWARGEEMAGDGGFDRGISSDVYEDLRSMLAMGPSAAAA